VSITDHIPGLRGTGSRRGKTPAQLRAELDEATCQLVALATENDELRGERNQLQQDFDRAAIDYSTALDDLRQARETTARLRAHLANTHRIDVPCGIRDTTAIEDQATMPVPVITPVLPLHDAPFATDPGRN
jgi:hypothetical protein